jgi:transposase
MKFIQGKDRATYRLTDPLEALVSADNVVRRVEFFVENLDLASLGFKMAFSENGRPAYHPKLILKLFIYGYLNSTRSSRVLEKECSRNIEVMWLMEGLKPDHNTISNFRRDNAKGIGRVFGQTVKLAADFDLIGADLIAGDSTKLRAQNSKKNNFNPKKIAQHLERIDNKLSEYQAALSTSDGDSKTAIAQKIKQQQERKAGYEALSAELEASGDTQISTSDPESRQLITRNNITEVGYNVQTSVDAKNNLLIDFKVTNKNDSNAMGGMLRRAKTILKSNKFTALYDKGYHTGSQFEYARSLGIKVLVSIPSVSSHAPDTAYDVEHFSYDKAADQYICPAQQILSTNGKNYTKSNGRSDVQVKHYKTSACLSCEFFDKCTKNKAGRLIERSEYAEVIAANAARMEAELALYLRRQAIVEHPYGIIKRQWGFYYMMTKKSIKRASADVGLMAIAFNLCRLFNILPSKVMEKNPKSTVSIFGAYRTHFKTLWQTYFCIFQSIWPYKCVPLKSYIPFLQHLPRGF